VSLRSVQDWETGVSLPTAERLQALLRALLDTGGLSAGSEMSEARALWASVEREASRMHTPFDEEWFAGLLDAHSHQLRIPAAQGSARDDTLHPADGSERAHDWGEAPDTSGFVGRGEELALLQGWVLEERCRLVAVLGLGGIGKTSVAAKLAQTVAPYFERVYWRSLRNAPPVTEWLAGANAFLSDQLLVTAPGESERTTALLQLLRARRCLLVLDNSETLFEPGQPGVRYRAGMDGYGRVLQALAETAHQSCLLLTSREVPPGLVVSGGAVRALHLHGIGPADAQALLADKRLRGDVLAWGSLVGRYDGNGLALKMVGETIRQVYSGDVNAFLQDADATFGTVFGGIRRLLDAQAERLSPMEHDVLKRLAVEREPISLAELSREMAPGLGRRSAVIEAIETLRQRSLVERGERGATFMLQSMVLEYMTDRLIETVADEIGGGQPAVLIELPLIKAQAKDYVRQTQERLIGLPIVRHLQAHLTDGSAGQRLLALLDGWRGRPLVEQGYGPGNVVNLLRLHRGELRGTDLSRLALRQVYLQGVDAQDARLVDSHLADAVLAESFAYPTAVALSADGALLAAGTLMGEVRLWRAADRTLLLTRVWPASTIWSVALSADARLLAVGSEDGTVTLVETGTDQLRATLRGHSAAVKCVSFSGDGRLVASGGDDGTVRLWDSGNAQCVSIVQGHTTAVWGVALSGNGRVVAGGGMDGAVRLWDVVSGQLLATLQGHTAAIWGVALSDDGRLVASGGVDGTLRLWDARSGQLSATLGGHTAAIWGVALSKDGRLVASGGVDGTLRLWDAESGQRLVTLQGHAGAVRCIALSADGRLVASGGVDGTVRLWEAARGQLLATVQGQIDLVVDVAMSGDGQVVLSASADGTVRLWERVTGHVRTVLQGHTGLVYRVALSRDARLAVTAGADGTVRLWDTTSGRTRAVLEGHIRLVFGVELSGDGRLVASGGADGTVRLWESESGHFLASLQGHSGAVRDVALSENAGLVASGGEDGTVRLWDTASGQLLASLQAHEGVVRTVALSGDGQLVAAGGADGTVRLWATRSGQLRATLSGHVGAVRGVALSPNGELAATGDIDGTVRLWESESGQLLTTQQGHASEVFSVAFSGDGRLVASCGDGTIRIWEASTGACLNTLKKDRPFQRVDITRLSGVTDAQRTALLALGAIEQSGSEAPVPKTFSASR